MTPAMIAILNALVAASANSAQLAALYQSLRGDGTKPPREPTEEEWAALHATDAAARASFQKVIDAMPDAPAGDSAHTKAVKKLITGS